jgi:hypothetical protein
MVAGIAEEADGDCEPQEMPAPPYPSVLQSWMAVCGLAIPGSMLPSVGQWHVLGLVVRRELGSSSGRAGMQCRLAVVEQGSTRALSRWWIDLAVRGTGTSCYQRQSTGGPH